MPRNQLEGFLPADYIEKRVERRTNLLSLTLFVMVMAGVVAAFYVTDQQRREVRSQQALVNAQFEEAAKRLEQLDQLQQRKQQMIRKAKVTSALIERVQRSVILAEMINNMPLTLSLLELEMQTKVINTPATVGTTTALDKARASAKAAIEEPPIKPTEVSFRLVGVAPTDVQVAQFMTALSRCALFTDVNLAFSEEVTIDQQAMRKFRIELKLSPQVDPRQFEPTLVKRELKQNPMGDRVQIAPTGPVMPQAPAAGPSALVPVPD